VEGKKIALIPVDLVDINQSHYAIEPASNLVHHRNCRIDQLRPIGLPSRDALIVELGHDIVGDIFRQVDHGVAKFV
jgi:hypothetical protein